MTNRQTSSKPKALLITPSLLNSWLYIWQCRDNVRESENDEACLEDKKDEASEKAKAEFLDYLNKVPREPNEYMLQGIQFEKDCYDGKTELSPIIQGGAFQISGSKRVEVDGQAFLMYGRLDVLKAGTIYDIKRVVRYSRPKYSKSSQHRFYLDLFPSADRFTYLIYDGAKLHKETYCREECIPTESLIAEFAKWLKENGLFEVYKEKWTAKGE